MGFGKLGARGGFGSLGLLGTVSNPLVNWGSSNWSFWRAARANALAGTGRAKILTVGDSTTAGVGAFTSSGLRVGSYPADLATDFATAGLPATKSNVFCTANVGTPAQYSVYNPDLTFAGSNWTTGGTSAGGSGFANAVDSLAASYTPAVQVDTFELTYVVNTAFGTLSYNVDGGAATNINCNGTKALQKAVISTTLGAHTLNISRASGGSIIFFDIVAYNSAQKAADVLNAGWGSSTSTNWNDNSDALRPRSAILFQAPDLLIIQLGINDYTPATLVSVATFQANLNAIIGDNIASRSILLMTPVPSISSRQTIAIQQTYIQAVYAVAAQNNLPLFDNWKLFGSEAQSSQYYLGDGVHLNELGYAKEAAALAPALLAA